MNQLKGKIEVIKTSGQLSLLTIAVKSTKITAIVIDTPKTASYLKLGGNVNVLFKATEVIIGKGDLFTVSLQNQFLGTILSIEKSDLLCKLIIKTAVGNIESIITSNAVNKLHLQVDDVVAAMVKTNEIMLSA